MPPKHHRNRSVAPAWIDTLITWLEVIALIGIILSGLHALFTLLGG